MNEQTLSVEPSLLHGQIPSWLLYDEYSQIEDQYANVNNKWFSEVYDILSNRCNTLGRLSGIVALGMGAGLLNCPLGI